MWFSEGEKRRRERNDKEKRREEKVEKKEEREERKDGRDWRGKIKCVKPGKKYNFSEKWQNGNLSLKYRLKT